MSHSRHAIFVVLTAAAAATTASELTPLAAAAPAPATVSIRRYTTLNQRVLTGDLNRDGIVDLVASDTTAAGSPGYLLVSLGNGDGTFKTPIKTTFPGVVLAVADFNGDGKLDVVGATYPTNRSGGVYIMAGKGDGTLGSPQLISNTLDVTFALAADFDGDRKLDLFVFTQGFNAKYFAGSGDLTFLGPFDVASKGGVLGGAVADYDNDGKPDVVVASHDENAVTLYHNQSTPGQVASFGITDMPLDRSANDVALADLNHDGKLDLVVATSSGEPGFSAIDGYVYVLMGHGSDAFSLPVKYQVPPLAWQVEIGDFNRDGLPDIATANRSPLAFDDCGPLPKTWDTVSILPGNGDGTFAAPSNFSLGDQSKLSDFRFRESVISLVQADVNRDGRPDLVASWGAIIINNPLDPNWAPHVSLGPDQTFNGSAELNLQAVASDSDNDMLTYRWSTNDGETLLPIPQPCLLLGPGVHVFTVTIDDQHGHTATDSVTITVKGSVPPNVTISAPKPNEVIPAGQPYTITFTATPTDAPVAHSDVTFFSRSTSTVTTICANLPASATQCVWNNPNPPASDGIISVFAYDTDGDQGTATVSPIVVQSGSGTLPSGWRDADIGAVAASGKAGFDATKQLFTVTGSGADIWYSLDEFHYAWTQITGDFQVETLVESVQNVQPWTKAGLMIRETTDPGSRHASVFATPGKGLAFQNRISIRGATTSTQGPGLTAPVWIRLTRRGDLIYAFYRKTLTDLWTGIGSQAFNALPTTLNVGFAVTAHQDGTLATATFSHLRLAPLERWTGTPVGTAGGTSFGTDDTVYDVVNRGADIWGTSDQFYFVSVPLNGDGTITARVRSVDDTNVWTKAGVMIRETLDATSKHVDIVATPGKGVAVQYRPTTAASSVMASQFAGITAPVWVSLSRHGATFEARWSKDGTTWTSGGTVSVSMTANVLVGLAVTSHNASADAAGWFDDVFVER